MKERKGEKINKPKIYINYCPRNKPLLEESLCVDHVLANRSSLPWEEGALRCVFLKKKCVDKWIRTHKKEGRRTIRAAEKKKTKHSIVSTHRRIYLVQSWLAGIVNANHQQRDAKGAHTTDEKKRNLRRSEKEGVFNSTKKLKKNNNKRRSKPSPLSCVLAFFFLNSPALGVLLHDTGKLLDKALRRDGLAVDQEVLLCNLLSASDQHPVDPTKKKSFDLVIWNKTWFKKMRIIFFFVSSTATETWGGKK